VKDFVLARDIGEYLRSKLPAECNGFTSIATAYLGFLKTTSHDHSLVAGIVRLSPGQNSCPFISHLNLALMYISEALKSEDLASASHYQIDISPEDVVRSTTSSIYSTSHHYLLHLYLCRLVLARARLQYPEFSISSFNAETILM
jgi:hypothetical protein